MASLGHSHRREPVSPDRFFVPTSSEGCEWTQTSQKPTASCKGGYPEFKSPRGLAPDGALFSRVIMTTTDYESTEQDVTRPNTVKHWVMYTLDALEATARTLRKELDVDE